MSLPHNVTHDPHKVPAYTTGAPDMSEHESTPIRRLTRRERRIERQRTQHIGYARRSTYRVSGRPDLARPAIWQRLAETVR